MKKSIAALALLAAATQAHSEPQPRTKAYPVTKVCIQTVKGADGSETATCNADNLNTSGKAKLLQNTCAKGQVLMMVTDAPSPLDSCMPPGVVQL